jgi:ABC-type branched-subunit amino acid transport system substrate-binding protein
MTKTALSGLFVLAMTAAPACAQDYVVGMTAALTGPASGTYAPAVAGMRLYIDKVNKTGGINGHRIKFVLNDDQGEASRAGANVKELLTEDNMLLLMNASLSSTYPPMVSAAHRAGVPLWFALGICPKEVYPPAAEGQYCTTQFGARYDTRAAFDFVKQKAAGDTVRIGIIALSIPVSRSEADFAFEHAKQMGFEAVAEEIAPPTTPDYAPFASRLIAANPNWIYSWGPWFMQSKVFESLRKLGWRGDFICAAQPEAELDLARVKDPRLYTVGPNGLIAEDSSAQREIIAAAKAANSPYPPTQLVEGWIAGRVLETVLIQAGWPTTTEKVKAAFSNLEVDLTGLRGGSLKLTNDNHFRAKQFYRVFHWNPETNKVDIAKDWFSYDVN